VVASIPPIARLAVMPESRPQDSRSCLDAMVWTIERQGFAVTVATDGDRSIAIATDGQHRLQATTANLAEALHHLGELAGIDWEG
jgi:hypothetical protein